MKRASLQNALAFDAAIRESDHVPRDSAQLRAVLEKFSFFHDLEPTAQADLPHIGHVVSRRHGTVLFREGDMAERCYIILSGKVDMTFTDKHECVNTRLCTSNERKHESPSAEDDGNSSCSTTASSRSGSSSRCSTKRLSVRSDRSVSFNLLNNVATSLAQAVERQAVDKVNEDGAHSLSLGAGRLIGDLALVQHAPQGFTASCTEDCELYVIERREFEQVLQENLERVVGEKINFLKTYLPGMKCIGTKIGEPLLHCFQKKSFPIHHVICNENVAAKKSLYLVSKGSVFLSSTNENMPANSSELRKMGSLFRGGVFGCLKDNASQPCTIACTSACEVFIVSGSYLRALPKSMRRSAEKYLSRTTEWCLNDDGTSPRDAVRKADVDQSIEVERLSPLVRKGARHATEPSMKKSPSDPSLRKSPSALGTPTQKAQAHSPLDALVRPRQSLRRKSSLPLLARAM